jgi:hypothetical protein
MRTVLDRPDAMPIVVLPSGTHGWAPVVIATTTDGDDLARVTIGWDDRTRALVRNDAATLRRWARRPPASFDVPAVLDETDWNGRALLMTTPPPAGRRSGLRVFDPGLEPVRETAAAGGLALRPLVSSPWWASVAERVGSADASRVVLDWMADLHGRRLVSTGSWHGDWRASNITSVGGRVFVSGWGRSGDGVPLGLDAIHRRFEDAARRGARRIGRVARLALEGSRDMLRGLGVPAEDEPLLMACYLAERLARLREPGRQEPATDVTELLAELRRWVGRR